MQPGGLFGPTQSGGVPVGVQATEGTLSTIPSQLLSRLSQISGWGLLLQTLNPPPARQQPGVPPGQFCCGLHVLTPAQLGGDGRPHGTDAAPSSTMPLQL